MIKMIIEEFVIAATFLMMFPFAMAGAAANIVVTAVKIGWRAVDEVKRKRK